MDTTAFQRLLIAAGYPLPRFGADGGFGSETRGAMQQFQRDKRLPVTAPMSMNQVDAETIRALQAAVAEMRPAAVVPASPPAVMRVSLRGIAEILSHEAIVTAPYKDSQGVWTIGVGHTKAAGQPDPAAIAKGVQRPVAEMIAIFKADLPKYEAGVRAAVKVPLEQHQFDALVSFHFNTGAIARASFVADLNAGLIAGAAAGIMAWNKPAEIIERRRAEQTLFRSGVYSNDGKATVYPASAAGKVLWSKRQRVSVTDLI